MNEKFEFKTKKEPTKADRENIIPDVEKHEIESWKELYPKINIEKVLQKIKELIDLEYQYQQIPDIDEDPEWSHWDGDVTFWGLKREIMMLFDSDKESNHVFKSLPDPAKDVVRKINVEDYLKK